MVSGAGTNWSRCIHSLEARIHECWSSGRCLCLTSSVPHPMEWCHPHSGQIFPLPALEAPSKMHQGVCLWRHMSHKTDKMIHQTLLWPLLKSFSLPLLSLFLSLPLSNHTQTHTHVCVITLLLSAQSETPHMAMTNTTMFRVPSNVPSSHQSGCMQPTLGGVPLTLN